MKEYIVPFTDGADMEKFEAEHGTNGELIRCKYCRFRDKDGECTQFNAYTSAAGDPFSPPDWFYCGYGKRKEE